MDSLTAGNTSHGENNDNDVIDGSSHKRLPLPQPPHRMYNYYREYETTCLTWSFLKKSGRRRHKTYNNRLSMVPAGRWEIGFIRQTILTKPDISPPEPESSRETQLSTYITLPRLCWMCTYSYRSGNSDAATEARKKGISDQWIVVLAFFSLQRLIGWKAMIDVTSRNKIPMYDQQYVITFRPVRNQRKPSIKRRHRAAKKRHWNSITITTPKLWNILTGFSLKRVHVITQGQFGNHKSLCHPHYCQSWKSWPTGRPTQNTSPSIYNINKQCAIIQDHYRQPFVAPHSTTLREESHPSRP